MSFICEKCNKVQENRSAPHKVVFQVRKKRYPVRRDENDIVIDKGGEGIEIVSEKMLCDRCYQATMSK